MRDLRPARIHQAQTGARFDLSGLGLAKLARALAALNLEARPESRLLIWIVKSDVAVLGELASSGLARKP